MNANATKKVSVFLPADLHRQLKVKAAQHGTSIQKLMLTAAESITAPVPEGAEAPDIPRLPSFSPKDKKGLLAAFKSILDSGDDLAILNCAATTQAMELWVEDRRQHPSTIITMPAPSSPKIETQPKQPSRRKSGGG